MLIGGGIGAVSWLLASVVAVGLVVLFDVEGLASDVGKDLFDRAARIMEWSDERLRAAALGEELPSPPRLYANPEILRIAFGSTLVHQVLLVAIVGVMTKQAGFREMWRTFGFDRFRARDVWRPMVAMIALYAMVAVYALGVRWLDLDFLEPESTVPVAVTRDGMTLAMAAALACVAAPVSEELFFRGLIFRGLLKWGFLPAAALSGLIFAGVHLDIGSIIPFFIIGVIVAWLYWVRGSLMESVIFHFLFNTTSILLLIAQR